MVTAGLVAAGSCGGPSSFLRVWVARMDIILLLRRAPYIGHSGRTSGPLPLAADAPHLRPDGLRDLQDFLAPCGGLQAVHATRCGPHQRRSRQQRLILVDA